MTDLVEVPPPRPQTSLARKIDILIQVCAIVPYSVVALLLRVLMARAFFLPGQEMIDGPKYPYEGMAYEITLPQWLRDDALRVFEQQLAGTSIPAKLAGYLVAYAEFALPILLVIGIGTRFTVLALALLLVFIDQYLGPGLFWSLHVFWYAIFLVLLSCGPGLISADYLVCRAYER